MFVACALFGTCLFGRPLALAAFLPDSGPVAMKRPALQPHFNSIWHLPQISIYIYIYIHMWYFLCYSKHIWNNMFDVCNIFKYIYICLFVCFYKPVDTYMYIYLFIYSYFNISPWYWNISIQILNPSRSLRQCRIYHISNIYPAIQ